MLRRVAGGVVTGMNGDVYVGVRYHGSWINHVEEVIVESCCMKGHGAGDWHSKMIAGRREGVIE